MDLHFALDPLPTWVAAAVIATLLAHAALTKLGDVALFEQHLSAYRVAGAATAGLARAIPVFELGTAMWLLSPWRAAGALLAALLLGSYGAAMAWHRWLGHELDCGCGGEPLPVSWALVARNGLLALLALLAASPITDRRMGLADFAVVAAAVPLAALLYAALNQILRHQAGLRMRHSH